MDRIFTRDGDFRLCVGNWRVIYSLNDERKVLLDLVASGLLSPKTASVIRAMANPYTACPVVELTRRKMWMSRSRVFCVSGGRAKDARLASR